MPEFLQNIVSLVLGYSIGSLPTAYLLVKWIARMDIRHEGTGNVGMMNALEVTNRRGLGIAVLCIDVAKGAAAVWVGSLLGEGSFWNPAAAGIGCILGHNYSLWIGWKGGRGLASAAGVLLLMGWILIAVWCVLWGIIYMLRKDIHAANILATLLSPVGCGALLRADLIRPVLGAPGGYTGYLIFTAILCELVLVRHAEYVSNIWKKAKT